MKYLATQTELISMATQGWMRTLFPCRAISQSIVQFCLILYLIRKNKDLFFQFIFIMCNYE